MISTCQLCYKKFERHNLGEYQYFCKRCKKLLYRDDKVKETKIEWNSYTLLKERNKRLRDEIISLIKNPKYDNEEKIKKIITLFE